MESIDLCIPSLEGENDHLDLENVLVGISGVADVTFDATGHTVRVQYDPDFGHPDLIRTTVVKSGYPVSEAAAGEEREQR